LITNMSRIHHTEPILRKRKEQDEQLEAAEAALTGRDASKDSKILSATLEGLARMIANREVTSVQAVGAFAARALDGHAKHNILTEVMITQAIKEARQADENRPSKIPPLYGVPVSFKDTFHVKGYDSCFGFSSLSGKHVEKDGSIVRLIRQLGGIPLVKTNVPQTLLAFDSENPVFGATSNPYNKDLIPGGSSGGEAALLAYNGAPLGFGSDVGGSLRIPTGFCGIYALKPTQSRLPKKGHSGATRGQIAIPAVVGPMARNLTDLQFITKLILEQKFSDWDPADIDMPWRKLDFPKKLRFGYYWDDGIVRSTPAVKRSILETVEALKRAGHEVFEYKPYNTLEAVRLFFGIMGSDSMRTLTKYLPPDPYSPAVKGFIDLTRIPMWVRRVIGAIARWYNQPVVATIVGTETNKDVTQLWQIQDELRQYQLDFYEDWKNQTSSDGKEMDGIIAPVMAIPAPVHGATKRVGSAAVATYLYNLLDYTVGVVPASVVDTEKDKMEHHPTHFDGREKGWLEAVVYKYYDVELQKNAPIGIQVVGKTWEEEKVLHMMKVVDDALEKSGRKKAQLP